MRVTGPLTLCILAAAVLGLLSCGLFEPRKPNRPPPVPSGCRSPTSSLEVFENIQDDVVGYGKIGGLTCYSSMLEADFLFHADPQDSVTDPAAYIGWNQEVESRVNGLVATDQDSIQVRFLDDYSQPIYPNADTEIDFRNYQVLIRSKAQLGSPDLLKFVGRADLTFHRGAADQQWRIADWVDHRSVNDSTWGFLRRQYRVGF